ncbi:MAG: biotin--[acetyl-CoA-carboxylase] ligase, partial [bacterium]
MRTQSSTAKAVDRAIPPVSEYLTETQIREGLRTSFVGRKIFSFGVLKSTQDYALRLAEEGAEEGVVVIAEEQTGGRGRFGRVWYSPPGVGVWCSLILRPKMLPWESPRLTIVAALAAARAIESSAGPSAALKWPNDVLINNRKVCGILTELSAEAESVNFVIIGIGVNVNQAATHFPSHLRHRATSLRIECGHQVSRIKLLQS